MAMSAIEAPLEDQLFQRLDRLTELLGELTGAGVLEPKRQRLSQSNVAGAAIVTFGWQTAPGGVNSLWLIERVTFSVTTAQASPTAGLFVLDSLPISLSQITTALDDQYLVETPGAAFPTNKRQVIGESSAPIEVKAGEWIIFQFGGLVAGDFAKGRVQIKQAWQGQD